MGEALLTKHIDDLKVTAFLHLPPNFQTILPASLLSLATVYLLYNYRKGLAAAVTVMNVPSLVGFLIF